MNAGILGTGPEQWAALEKYLRTEHNFKFENQYLITAL